METPAGVLECSKCGAPLDNANEEGADSIRCSYCGAIHRFAPAPPPSTPVHTLRVDSPVLVHWGNHWWNARVIRVVSEAAWEITYDGWPSNWDEVVGPDRISALGAEPNHPDHSIHLPRHSVSVKKRSLALILVGAVVLLLVVIGLTLDTKERHQATASAVTPPAPGSLVTGTRVRVLWKGKWYDATVLYPLADGRLRIHYVGWDESWDEEVTLDRVEAR